MNDNKDDVFFSKNGFVNSSTTTMELDDIDNSHDDDHDDHNNIDYIDNHNNNDDHNNDVVSITASTNIVNNNIVNDENNDKIGNGYTTNGVNNQTYIDIELDDDTKLTPLNSPRLSDSDTQTHNGWTNSNIETVRNWKSILSKTTFVYEVVIEKYKKRINYTLTIALILGTLATIITAISSALLAVDDKNYVWAAFSLNVVVFVLTGSVSIFNGILQITGWQDFVNELTKFVEKMDILYAKISNELVLPAKLRTNAVDFIKTENVEYLNIMMQSPDIRPSDYQYASKKYKKHVETGLENYKYSQIYNNDAIIDM